MPHDAQRGFGETVFREHVASDCRVETDAPAAVEITLLRGENSLLVFFVNYQKELPNIPLANVRAVISLPFPVDAAKAKPIIGEIQAAAGEKGLITIEVANLETLAAIEIPSDPNA